MTMVRHQATALHIHLTHKLLEITYDESEAEQGLSWKGIINGLSPANNLNLGGAEEIQGDSAGTETVKANEGHGIEWDVWA